MNEIQAYYDRDALNFSFLKFFLHPDPYYAVNQYNKKSKSSRLYFEEREHLNRGSLLDCMITTPELYNKGYCNEIIDKKPPEKIMSIINYLYDNKTWASESMSDFDELYLIEVADKEEFWHSRRKENGSLEPGGRDEQYRIDEILKWESYWDYLIKADGRVILSQSEIDLAKECYNAIMTRYGDFINKCQKQLAIYKPMFGYNCKGLLDLAHITDTTIQVVDLKSTSEPLYKIPYLLRDKKWIYQVVWYSLLLQKIYPNHTLLRPSLLISSTTEPDNPQMVKISEKDFKIALNGNDDVKGIKQAIHYYKLYQCGARFEYKESNIWK